MNRKLRMIFSLGLISIVAAFISLPFVGVVAAIGFFGGLPSVNSCTAVADTALTNESSLTGMTADEYLNQFSKEEQASMLAIAQQIYQVGEIRQPAESKLSITIAIAVAIEESDLTNTPKGTSDSHGVFQQRPSQGWGTKAQVMDVAYAANAFFDDLDKVQNIESKSMMAVAIEVQKPSNSAYHLRWQWDKTAAEILTKVAAHGAAESCVTNGWQSPLTAKSYLISSTFGQRFDPFYHLWQLHDGIDLAAPEGTPVHAVHAGVVSFAGVNGGYGNYVSLINDSSIVTGYGHLVRIAPGISSGVQVNGGEVIGYVGSTGASTGNHLHFLVHIDGKPVDPAVYMNGVGVSIQNDAKG